MNSPTFCSKWAIVFGTDVELLIAGLQRLDDALVAQLEIDGQHEFNPLLFAGLRPSAWPARSARAECSTACPCGPDLRSRPGKSPCRRASASAFFSAIASEPAEKIVRIVPRAIIASRSSSLSILMPLNTTSCAFRQSSIGPSNSRATYLPERHALHRQRHDRARGIETAGRQGFVDVDRRDLFGERIGERRQLRREMPGSASSFAFQSTVSMS